MRPLELLLVALLAVTLLGAFRRRKDRPRWMRPLPAVLAGLVVLHAVVEHARWQLVPAYLLVGVIAFRALRSAGGPAGPSRPVRRGLGVVGSLATLALSTVLAVGFPIFEPPAPSGPLGVGTAQLVLVDSARVDAFAPTAGAPRELLLAVWYPADVPAGTPRDPFWPRGATPSEAIGLPEFMFSHVPLIPAHSTAGAPVAKARPRYPVLVFSHGFNSTPWQNTVQMEELASHGFIVVSIGHTYDASAIRFPDGRVVRDNSRRRPQGSAEVQAPLTRRWMLELRDRRDPDSIRAEWRELKALMTKEHYFGQSSIDVWTADVRGVLDRLEGIDAGHPSGISGPVDAFAGRLDLDRIGVFGMSFGGSTAGIVCMTDPRCKAGLNLDGGQFGDPDATPLHVPFLYVTNGWNNTFPVYAASTADLYEVHVARSEHGNFSDFSLMAPLFTWLSRPSLPLLGAIPGDEVVRAMSRYTLAFFQQYLKGIPQPALDAPAAADLPDVTLTKRPAPGPSAAPPVP